MTDDELKQSLNERITYDIGQFTKEQLRWLRRGVKVGTIQSMMIYQRFPIPKRGYWIADEQR